LVSRFVLFFFLVLTADFLLGTVPVVLPLVCHSVSSFHISEIFFCFFGRPLFSNIHPFPLLPSTFSEGAFFSRSVRRYSAVDLIPPSSFRGTSFPPFFKRGFFFHVMPLTCPFQDFRFLVFGFVLGSSCPPFCFYSPFFSPFSVVSGFFWKSHSGPPQPYSGVYFERHRKGLFFQFTHGPTF